MEIDQRRLEVLRAFAQQKTMAAAAERLHMTTSAVSQHLALLEREVEVQLIQRVGRRATLTEAGEALVKHADTIAAEFEAAAAHMRRFSTTVRGTVRIGAFPSFCSAVLPGTISGLSNQFPELLLDIVELEPNDSLVALRNGSIDIAVIDDLAPLPLTALETLRVATDELLLCKPRKAGDLDGEIVGIEDLADARWVLDGSQSVFGDYLRRICTTRGYEPQIVARCNSFLSAADLVVAYDGVALVSGLNARRMPPGVHLSATDPRCTRGVYLAWRQGARVSPQLQAVENLIVEQVHIHFSGA